MKKKTFKIGMDRRTKEFVPISVAKKNKARYEIQELPKTGITFRKMEAKRGGWSEWVYPTEKYLFKCCDCGLVHELQFKTFVEGEKKKGAFEVISLPNKIRAMFRARRAK